MLILLALPVMANNISVTTTTMPLSNDQKISETYNYAKDIFDTVKYDIRVFGTEYDIGENGTIFLQLIGVNNKPINNATCMLTLFYPNKTIFLNYTLMNYLSESDGIYFYDLTIPEQQGIYMLSVVCEGSYYEELIRGSGELHVFNKCEHEILCLLKNARILNDRVVNFHNHQYCIDNETLQHNVTYEYCVGNSCHLLVDIMNEKCNYGCDFVTNECSPNPTWNSIIYIIIFLAFIVIIYILSKVMGK